MKLKSLFLACLFLIICCENSTESKADLPTDHEVYYEALGWDPFDISYTTPNGTQSQTIVESGGHRPYFTSSIYAFQTGDSVRIELRNSGEKNVDAHIYLDDERWLSCNLTGAGPSYAEGEIP